MRQFLSTATLISAAILMSACSSTVKLEEKPAQTEAPAQKPVQPQADNRTVQPVVAETIDPLNDPKGVLAKRSVYFDFDSFVVKDDYKGVIQNHSSYLSKNTGRKISIEGNTDERGGREYNLALGQKRADAVRKSMAALGVSEAQMESVSFGKEKPKAQGSNEEAWAENRRADIVYK
ncbi:peptidoglycan-associated lipoprotein Pal [Massilia sp. W12]|uniref:peptidoglycan-associated lipoprotein Pal n=1 Tax=Massilia sp. W12 TaxID=3126507 RepID=UPI0030CFF3A5